MMLNVTESLNHVQKGIALFNHFRLSCLPKTKLQNVFGAEGNEATFIKIVM